MTAKSKNLLYKFIGGVTVASLIAVGLWWLNSMDDEDEVNEFIQVPDNDSNNIDKHSKIKMVISGKNIILNPDNPTEIDDNQISTLFALSDNFDIYIVIQVKDENEQNEIYSAISRHEIFKTGVLNINKVLFCATAPGKGHIARHIEPYIFVDDNVEIIDNFSKFIPKSICITNSNPSSLKAKNNVEVVDSLDRISSSLLTAYANICETTLFVPFLLQISLSSWLQNIESTSVDESVENGLFKINCSF
ncbi:hypothetical protein BCR36DRAFT_174802 [Piromyces finnis]|uniref:Peroxisome assembly protein 22 n=1 Tax=Piromyces finnis TaxID=1754191 RepID=A0A1Y1VI03_9FUNG|nr:hypothetical protein BCR36DRAFT_174802 [Piromyces finnis]|eukprot:ORX55963.1 hypothetical protein BCR36DRAFT_174802 [Piromyces finnis]